MLEKIKKILFESYWSEEEKWIFLSWYDENHDLLVSQWVAKSDLPLHELLDSIYDEIKEEMSSIVYVAVDVVSEIIQLENTQDILSRDPQEFWFILIWENWDSGVMLPWIVWIADAKHALYHTKKKYWIAWNVEVFVFRTERIVVSK